MRRGWRALALGAVLAVAANAASADEPVRIRAGWANTPASLTPIIFAKKDLAKHLGQSYTLEPVHFNGTSPEITALATGDLEIGTLAFSSVGAAIQNARMNDLRIICDGFQDGVEGYYTSEYMVLKDSPIAKVEDLKGKVLVTNAIGGAIDMGLRDMLRKHGLDPKKDVQILEANFPSMLPMLDEHKAELIGSVPPFTYIGKAKGTVRVLFTLKDASGTTDMIFNVARQGWIEKNRAALVDFHEDWLRALQWYLDPANHEEAVRLVAEYTKLPEKSFEPWLFTKADYYRDPQARPNLEALQRNIETQQELGFLKSSFEVAKYTDLSLVDEAAKRLK